MNVHQYGFRKSPTVDMVLISVDLKDNLQCLGMKTNFNLTNIQVLAVLTADLSKAFDTLDHSTIRKIFIQY